MSTDSQTTASTPKKVETIRVMIVDDSAAARVLIKHILESEKNIEVIASLASGKQALEAIIEHRPDIVAMDLFMPGLDGMETTKQIMAVHPVPIVIVTANYTHPDVPFRMLDAGAVAVVEKPPGPSHPDYEHCSRTLIRTITSLAGVKLVRRVTSSKAAAEQQFITQRTHTQIKLPPPSAPEKIKAVLIGASTGGPQTLKTLLDGLPKDFPAPVIVVQHMAPGFMGGLAKWLNDSKNLKVVVAADGDTLQGGHVYLSPDDCQMAITSSLTIKLIDAPKEYGMRPSVSYLFRSGAQALGNECIGIILSGMGQDGSAELGLLQEAGALTIAQDHATSVVHGMPGVAISLGNAKMVLSPFDIAAELTRLVK